MNRDIGACIVCIALSTCVAANGQVINMAHPASTRTMKANQPGGQTDVTVAISPGTVTLAGGRKEDGWFTILSEPRQKLYWWRFQAGTVSEGATQPADDFTRNCKVYVATKQLVVFCTTARHLLIASSTRTYGADAAIPGLVQAEFNQRAGKLDKGFDYFDTTLNLWPVLGPDFFFEPGRANGIERITIKSVTRVGEDWETVVGGAGTATAKLTLAPDFSLKSSGRVQ